VVLISSVRLNPTELNWEFSPVQFSSAALYTLLQMLGIQGLTFLQTPIKCLGLGLDGYVIAAVVDSGSRRQVVGLNAFPQAVRASDGVLPQTKCPILAAAGIQLTVGGEPHAMHRPKVTFEWLCTSSESITEVLRVEKHQTHAYIGFLPPKTVHNDDSAAK